MNEDELLWGWVDRSIRRVRWSRRRTVALIVVLAATWALHVALFLRDGSAWRWVPILGFPVLVVLLARSHWQYVAVVDESILHREAYRMRQEGGE